MTITQQQIIALAVEAGFDDITPWLDAENVEQGQIDAANRWIERMTAFAALIGFKVFEKERQIQAIAVEAAYQRGVRDERERCVKAFEKEADSWTAWPQAGAAKRKGVAAIYARNENANSATIPTSSTTE